MVAEQDPAVRAVYDAQDTNEAMSKAEAAVKKAKDTKNKALEGQAKEAMVSVLMAKESYDEASEVAESAVAVYKEAKDTESWTRVLGTIIEMKLWKEDAEEVMKIAVGALEEFKKSKDAKGQASALLLCAQVKQFCKKRAEAIETAKEALQLSKGIDDKQGQAQALLSIYTIDFNEERGEAIPAAEERVQIFRSLGDKSAEANALIILGNAHIARMAKKLGTCTIASAEDSIAALKAAKEAYGLCKSSDAELMDGAMQVVVHTLSMNGVSGEVIQNVNDPDEVFQDVMSGKYTTAQNALPPVPQPKAMRLEDVVPSSKQLERGKFSWNNPLAGHYYTLIWQHTKDREQRNRKPRGTYDVMFTNTGTKSRALTQAFQTRCNSASERHDAFVVHMNSPDCSTNYGANLMDATHVISAMVTAKCFKLCMVNLSESFEDYTDTKVSQVATYHCQLAILRSARLEQPNMTIGYVGGDAASWCADPAPMIESIFDVIECDESEVIYKRGDCFAPLLIHCPLEDEINFVKPKRRRATAKFVS